MDKAAEADDAPNEIDHAQAQGEADYEKFVWDNLRRNYIANYLHGMLGMTGFRIINAPTFIPVYLHALAANVPAFLPFGLKIFGGPDAIVGVGMALQQLGAVVSPIVGASQIEHRKRVLPASMLMGTLMRVQILGMAIAGWVLIKNPLPLLLTMVGFLFLYGLFSGAQRVAFQLLLAKVIPISRRGRLQAWRNLTGGLIAAVLAWVAGKYFIGHNVFGNGYSTTFAFAFILTSLGLTALRILLREPEPPTVRAQLSLRDRIREFPAMITGDRDFAFFMLAQTFAVAGRIAAPFYILFVRHTIELTGSTIGLISLFYLGADTVTNLLWGYLGDKSGFRSTFVIALVLWIGATALLVAAHSEPVIILAFIGLGAAQSGYQMSSQTMVLEFGLRDDMAMRLAFSATAEGLMSAIGPLAGGVIATLLGYTTLFGTSITFEILALIVLLTLVREPRLRKAATI